MVEENGQNEELTATEEYVENNEVIGDDEEEMEVETTLYRVVTRSEEKVIDGRIEAVEDAKAISKETGQNVLVEREDGRVKMNFREGALVDYVLRHARVVAVARSPMRVRRPLPSQVAMPSHRVLAFRNVNGKRA